MSSELNRMNPLPEKPICAGGYRLTVAEYHDSSSFDLLAHRWDRLLTRSSMNTPFLTRQWQKLWWNLWHRNRRLRIVAVSEASGELCGLAPLFAEEEADRQVLNLLGSPDVCDYLDCIVARGKEESFYRTLLSHLLASSRGPATIHFHSLQHCSPAISFLAEAAEREGCAVALDRADTAPLLDLPLTVASYHKMLTKKDRHEIGRKKRRAEKAGSVTFRTSAQPSEVMEIFPRFIALFRKTAPGKDTFLTPERERFFWSVAEEFSRKGWLEFSVLSLDEKEVAYLLCFQYNKTCYLYNAAYDPAYAGLSPGIVAITCCLEDSITRGIRHFDFLRGDETYKYRFGARDKQLYRLTVSIPGEGKS